MLYEVITGVEFDRIIASPWARAQQTTQILAGKKAFETSELLAAPPGEALLEV